MIRNFYRRTALLFFIAMALAMTLAIPAEAADAKKAAREQVKRLQQMQRKLEQDNIQITQEKTVLDVQVKELQGKLGTTQRGAENAAHRSAALGKELKTVAVAKQELELKLAESEKKLADKDEVLRRSESANRQLETTLAQRATTLSACEAKNDAMHKDSLEILDKYQKKGCGSSLLQKEPFTQLKQVEIENYVETERDKLDQQTLDKAASH